MVTDPESLQHSDLSVPAPPIPTPPHSRSGVQTSLLTAAGIKLGTWIISKAPHLIPESERGPADMYAQETSPPPCLVCLLLLQGSLHSESSGAPGLKMGSYS